MSRRVFLSHHSGDVEIARKIRLNLEEHGYECWMAPDSVTGGRSWPEQILAAIKGCDAMLILVSAASNESTHVSKEVELAVGSNKALLPVRIANVEPSGNLEYLLALAQWTNAYAGPIDRHLDPIRRRVSEVFDASVRSPAVPPPARATQGRWRKPAAALVLVAVMGGSLTAALGLFGSGDEPGPDTTEPLVVAEETSSTTATSLPEVVIARFGPAGPPDDQGCVNLNWAVDNAANLTLAAPGGGVERVDAEDGRQVCGETGDVAVLSCEAADGTVTTAEYMFEVDLSIESVDTEVRGRLLLVDVTTNQAADVSVSLIGRASEQTSTGKSIHHLEFTDQVSGPVELQVVASRADLGDAVATELASIPYYSMRVSLVEGPAVVTTTTTSTTTTTTVAISPSPTLVVIGTVDLNPIPIFVNPDILRLAFGFWYTYSAQPVAAYLGRACDTTFLGDEVEQLVVPTGLDGSAETTISVDWCPPDGIAAGPLPSDPDSGQIITIGPGFDAASTEVLLSFPMNDMALEIRVLVERIITEEPPDYS